MLNDFVETFGFRPGSLNLAVTWQGLIGVTHWRSDFRTAFKLAKIKLGFN